MGEIERGLEEDTPQERRFCYFFLLSRRPNTSCIEKVGKTDLGLSYFLGEKDIFHRNLASFSTVLLLCNGLFSFFQLFLLIFGASVTGFGLRFC